jgi:ABC-type glycerol-3-phosphate transport system permease component
MTASTHEDFAHASVTGLSIRPRRQLRIGRILLFIVMVIVAIVMFYPFVFMISASFKTQAQYIAGEGFSLESWQKLAQTLPVGQQTMNSLIVCALSIGIIIIVSTMAGFAFAKLRYRRSTLVFLLIIAAMLIPMQSIIIPAYVNISKLHLLTTYFGAVIVYAAYYRSLPDELLEAALIDGVGYWGIFRRIALPLSIPAIVTIGVLQFIQIWGDLLIGLLFLQNPAQRTITVGLGALSAGRVTEIPVLMAGSLVSAIPAVIVYLIFQQQLVKGLTAGISK